MWRARQSTEELGDDEDAGLAGDTGILGEAVHRDEQPCRSWRLPRGAHDFSCRLMFSLTLRSHQTQHPQIRSVFEKGRQLITDHLAEIEACPDDVYASDINQDGSIPEDRVLRPPIVQVNRRGNNLKIGLF